MISYKAAPVCSDFHNSEAFVRGIMGPIGSGKSVACCIEMFKKSKEQKPSPNGIRKTRWLVVRNTLPQLETTTIKTWTDWFPPSTFGHMTGKPPYTHRIKYDDVEMEVIFIALDKPEDVKKLLSFECTGIWFNEAREIQKELVDAATGRVGRYPSSKDGGCTWSGIIMDTNPPNDSHWWYHIAEEDCPKNWEFFQQPSGTDIDHAENPENLMQPKGYEKMTIKERRKHGIKYYERMIGGKTKEWINVYVHGKYGFIQDGKPVYGTSWNDELHSTENLELNPNADIICGVDCSGRNPAAIFIQRNSLGQIQVLKEIVCKDIGAVGFSQLLKSEVQKCFPYNNISFYGDPAGTFKAQNDEKTYFEILRAHDIMMLPAPTTNAIGERLQAVESLLLRLIGGKPAIIIDKVCVMLRRGFNGGYRFRRLNVGGDAMFDPKPDKTNGFSDPQDALQYAVLGAGEGNRMKGRGIRRGRAGKAKMDFNVFN